MHKISEKESGAGGGGGGGDWGGFVMDYPVSINSNCSMFN